MEYSSEKTLLEYFYSREKGHPQKVFLRQPFGDNYKDFTWEDVGKQARKIASYLKL